MAAARCVVLIREGQHSSWNGQRVTPQTLIGEAGVALVAGRVNAMGYLFHDRRVDHGIDGEIELVAEGTALNRLIAVQVKASNRPFPKETAETFEWTADASDLSYWLHGNVPVIVVLSHPDRDEAWGADARDSRLRLSGVPGSFSLRSRRPSLQIARQARGCVPV